MNENFGGWGFDEVTRLATALTAGILWSVCFGQAKAQDAEAPACAPEVTENRHAFVLHEGQPGIWWNEPVARCLIAGFGALRLVKEELSLTNMQLRLRSDQLAKYQQAVSASVAVEIEIRKALELAKSHAETGFLESPLLWGPVRFGLGLAVTVLTMFAVRDG